MSDKSVKISANLPEDALERLKTLAYERGTTMTEVLRRAIEHEQYFSDVIKKEGKILTEDSKGNIRQVIMK
ncbi:MAG: CopG family transcriptional regulator [Paracoccaceae bacterium]